ncbi:hypothetical protein ACW9UR_23785 [Halovulum sp. GXIMD14794]
MVLFRFDSKLQNDIAGLWWTRDSQAIQVGLAWWALLLALFIGP